MIEIWKDIEGFEGWYKVSNFGKVKYLGDKFHKEKERKLVKYPNGYLHVVLRKDEKSYMRYIARLVAKAFIPNPDNKPEVNHIDGNKENNKISNLEWCTSSENKKHAFVIGLRKPRDMRGENNSHNKLTQKEVDEIREKYQNRNKTQIELATEYGVIQAHISRIVRNMNWS